MDGWMLVLVGSACGQAWRLMVVPVSKRDFTARRVVAVEAQDRRTL